MRFQLLRTGVTKIEVGCSIEGHRLGLAARRISSLLPKRIGEMKIFEFRVELRDNARAVIEKELLPKVRPVRTDSMLQEGDKLQARVIAAFSEKMPSRKAVQHDTSAHKGQFCCTKGHSYARVDQIYPPLAASSNLLRA